MISIPYDVELIIYRYLHELYMIDVSKELSNIRDDIKILSYLQKNVFYPYKFWDRIRVETKKSIYITVIDKYVHKKRMERVLSEWMMDDALI